MTAVTDLHSQIISCILSSIDLNVEEIVLSYSRNFKIQWGLFLFFPSLITKLWKSAEMEEYVTDTWVDPGPHIFPLMIQGKGAPNQSKNRKVDN